MSLKRQPERPAVASGFTMLELLCVIGIITILATLLLGPASRVLGRVLADKWSEDASVLLDATVKSLNQHFQGQARLGLVTLQRIEAEGLLKPAELQFLKDRRVTFFSFNDADPGDKVVILVQLKRGFWTERSALTELKDALVRGPE
jgi:prepilin-type N-terminal cleavage/methylation domain-containing protein